MTVTFNEQELFAQLAGLPTVELKQRIETKLQECADKLNYYSRTNVRLPTVVYDLQGRTAGWAHYSENKIRMNIALLYSDTEEMIEQTLPHEFAHIASYNFYGREGTGHGKLWKRTMRELGLVPDRCHSMETTPQRVTQKFHHPCNCDKGYCIVGKNVHNKIQNGRQYTCGKCGNRLFKI